MCGITGWVAFDRDMTREGAVLDAMTQTMACWGPDATGVWSDRHAGLGHRRLAVIDLPGGAQPMSISTPNGEVVMVYSGETYNFTELRAELLGRGERFETSSDTEVVLRGYLHWGEALVERLNGMFAFAIWDARHRKLVMVRDRIGVKPFYFYRTPDGVLFGSEPKAILANPLVKRVVDINGLREMFGFVKTPGQAIWKGMSEVVPGTIVTVDERGLRERTSWRLESRPHPDDLESTVVRVRELLDDIIRRQLVSDVPQCTLLSGGLDSSTVTALAARYLDQPVRSFAVDFAGQTENFTPTDFRPALDTPYVHDVANHVGADHTDIVLDHAALADPDIRRKAVTARDIPGGLGDMDVSLYLLFKAIRQHSTVALSGVSADEVFGGYREFHDPKVRQADVFPWQANPDGPSNPQIWIPTPALRSAMDLDTYRQDRYHEAVSEVTRLTGEDDFAHRMRVMSYLHLTRFVRILLDRKDRISLAVGLEVRVPFCDHRLVEYVYNTPWSLKTNDGREKSLLRGAAQDVLPRSVVERKKVPHPSSQDPQYGAAIQQQAKDVIGSADDTLFNLIDRTTLEAMTEHDAGNLSPMARHSMEVILELAQWLDIYRPTVVI